MNKPVLPKTSYLMMSGQEITIAVACQIAIRDCIKQKYMDDPALAEYANNPSWNEQHMGDIRTILDIVRYLLATRGQEEMSCERIYNFHVGMHTTSTWYSDLTGFPKDFYEIMESTVREMIGEENSFLAPDNNPETISESQSNKQKLNKK